MEKEELLLLLLLRLLLLLILLPLLLLLLFVFFLPFIFPLSSPLLHFFGLNWLRMPCRS